MIFNLRIFKKLVKDAYNGGGLIAGREGEEYILCGGSWAVRIKVDAFDKEYKAAVIEHIGDLPRDGVFVSKSKTLGDREMSEDTKTGLQIEGIEQECYPADLTNVYIRIGERLCRMIQCMKRNVLIKEELVALVEDVKEEGMEGPFCNPEEELQLYWHNSKCKYVAYIMDAGRETKDQKALELLQAVDLSRR